MNKTTALVTQVVMTFLMALAMSGIMGLIMTGPSLDWLARWPLQFLVAWPIAFALTLVAWPASMRIAARILRPRGKREASETA